MNTTAILGGAPDSDGLSSLNPAQLVVALRTILDALPTDQREAIVSVLQGDATITPAAKRAIVGILSPNGAQAGQREQFDPRKLFSAELAPPPMVSPIIEWKTRECDLTLSFDTLVEVFDRHGRRNTDYLRISNSGAAFRISTGLLMAIEGELRRAPDTGTMYAQIREITFPEHHNDWFGALLLAMPVLRQASGSFRGVVEGYQGDPRDDNTQTLEVRIKDGQLITEPWRSRRQRGQ